MILLSQCHDPAVDLHQIIFILNLWISVIVPDHKLIIAQRLDLQIIIEPHQTIDLLVRLALQNSPVKLSCFAGRPHDQSFLIFQIKTLWQLRPAVKIL